MPVYIALDVSDVKDAPAEHYVGKLWDGPILPIGTRVYFKDSNCHNATLTGYEVWPDHGGDVIMVATLSEYHLSREHDIVFFLEELASEGWAALDKAESDQ